MTDLSPRERRYQRTKDAILDAARRIIRTQGADALSIRAIADAIDYSPAGLYEYFGSKDEMIGELCRLGGLTMRRAMEQVDAVLPTPEYVVELGMVYIDFALNNAETFLLMFGSNRGRILPDNTGAVEPLLADPDLAESAFMLLVDALRRGVEEGVFHAEPGISYFDLAYGAWGLVHGLAMMHLTILEGLPPRFREVDRAILRRFMDGLQQPVE